jgi:Antitoxin VbhA
VKKLSKKQIEQNMRDVAFAIANQELDGGKVPKPIVADLYRVARGEIDTDEVRSHIAQFILESWTK